MSRVCRRTAWLSGLVLWVSLSLHSAVHVQFGAESFAGGRMRLLSVAPWFGLRWPASGNASWLFKFRQQALSFTYTDDAGAEAEQSTSLSTLIAAYYFHQKRVDAYGAAFQMFGRGGYAGSGLDVGGSFRLLPGLRAEAGLYLLNERSVLWYPNEPLRRITTFSGHGGLQWRIRPRWYLDGDVTLATNSEHVQANSVSLGVTFCPFDPLYINAAWMRYSESSVERRSGNYITAGVNFYF